MAYQGSHLFIKSISCVFRNLQLHLQSNSYMKMVSSENQNIYFHINQIMWHNVFRIFLKTTKIESPALAQMITKLEVLQAEETKQKNDEAKIHMTSVFRVFR